MLNMDVSNLNLTIRSISSTSTGLLEAESHFFLLRIRPRGLKPTPKADISMSSQCREVRCSLISIVPTILSANTMKNIPAPLPRRRTGWTLRFGQGRKGFDEKFPSPHPFHLHLPFDSLLDTHQSWSTQHPFLYCLYQ